jgi:CubicO group peptidase (beta-lactamase class C family)
MDAAPDRYRFILDRPIAGEPGVKWTYCGGATAVLGRLIAKGTGQSLIDFAQKAMYEPLGLGDRVDDGRRRRLARTPDCAERVAKALDRAGCCD